MRREVLQSRVFNEAFTASDLKELVQWAVMVGLFGSCAWLLLERQFRDGKQQETWDKTLLEGELASSRRAVKFWYDQWHAAFYFKQPAAAGSPQGVKNRKHWKDSHLRTHQFAQTQAHEWLPGKVPGTPDTPLGPPELPLSENQTESEIPPPPPPLPSFGLSEPKK